MLTSPICSESNIEDILRVLERTELGRKIADLRHESEVFAEVHLGMGVQSAEAAHMDVSADKCHPDLPRLGDALQPSDQHLPLLHHIFRQSVNFILKIKEFPGSESHLH